MSFNLHAQFFPVLNLNGVDKAAELQTLDIDIEIVGNIALTTVDMTFYNPNNRVMEGELNFPLTPSQEIVEFHLDVNGKLRKASVVEKQKGRVAYEATIRQNIDPGLLEKNSNNSFKARIFPIPAKGYKRAVFLIQEELQYSVDGYKYTLPLKSGYIIPEFLLKATLYSDKKPESPKTLEFIKWKDTFTLDFNQKKYKLSDEITFTIPTNDKNRWVDNSYFYTIIDVSDLHQYKQTRQVPSPIDVAIYWDISASSDNRDKELEYQFLKKYLNGLNEQSKIKIIPFNINTYKDKNFRANESREILEYLDNLKYDGGTRLGNLDLNSFKVDNILMFTDGVSTFERVTPPALPSIPIYTISSSYSSNTSLLRYYSIKTGGEYIDLHNSGSGIIRPKLIGIDTGGISEVYTDLEIDTDQFSVSGKLTDNSGELILHFIKPDGSKVKKVVTVKNISEKVGVDLERLWIQKKLESLDLLYDMNRDKITEIGKEYGFVTRNTSLIVLDRVQDYVTFDITPPVELQSEWDKLMALKIKRQDNLTDDNLSEVLNEMAALKSWWLKDFPKTKPRAPLQNKEMLAESAEFGIESDSEPEPLMSRAEAPVVESEDESFEMKKSKNGNTGNLDSITIEGWTPDVPYYKELSSLKGLKLLNRYYEIRETYKNRPSFFVDVATLFYEKGDKETALLIISNVIEMSLEEPELLRITAYLLEKFGYVKEALDISYKLLEVRAEEPQTYRDIASLSLLNTEYQQALEFYYKVLTGSWDSRFDGIKSVVLNEMNYLITMYANKLDLKLIDKRLIFDMPLGVRAVISWSSNNNDIDLWVLDPYKEDCGYSHNLTFTGGKLSSDFTGGYGPEEFSIKEALYGSYTVDINFYSDNRMSISGPVTVKVDLYKNYGKGVKKETIIRRLSDVKDRITIGKIKF